MYYLKCFLGHIRKLINGDEVMAQQLRQLAVLEEDRGSILSTQKIGHNSTQRI